MAHHRRTCGAWRNFYNHRRVCSFDKGHDGGHSWQVRPPRKPIMPRSGEQRQQDWWEWQITWFMEESQLGQRPYNMNSSAHRNAAELDLIDLLHEEANVEDLLR